MMPLGMFDGDADCDRQKASAGQQQHVALALGDFFIVDVVGIAFHDGPIDKVEV